MKKFFLCILLFTMFACPVWAGTPDNPDYVEGDVLVLIAAPLWSNYDPNRDAYSQEISRQAEVLANKYGLEMRGTYPEIAIISGKSIIYLRSEFKTTADLIKELSLDPAVEGVQPNYITPLDPPIYPIVPIITIHSQPAKNTTVTEGSITGSLSVEASISPIEAGTIVYQWYSNTTNSNTDGKLIPDVPKSANFTIPKTLTASGSPYYYYCSVEVNDINGDFIYNQNTEVAVITVNDENSGGGGCNSLMTGGGMFGILAALSTLWLGQKKKTAEKK